jgi:hypothetical protein
VGPRSSEGAICGWLTIIPSTAGPTSRTSWGRNANPSGAISCTRGSALRRPLISGGTATSSDATEEDAVGMPRAILRTKAAMAGRFGLDDPWASRMPYSPASWDCDASSWPTTASVRCTTG